MVLNSKQKKKISIALVVVFAFMILSGIGLGVYFFIKDKDGAGELSKSQVAFGTAIKNYNNKPQVSEMNFSSVYSGSVQNVVCYSDDYLAYRDSEQIKFIGIKDKQTVVLDFAFDEVVGIYGNVAHLKNAGENYVVNLQSKKQLSKFSNAIISVAQDFVLIKSVDGSVFDFYDNSTQSVTSLILNTKSCNQVFKSSAEDNIIDVCLEKNVAIIYSLAKTEVYSLLNNFEKVLEFANVGALATGDENNLKSSISSKTFIMIEYYKVKELSRNLLLLEKITATTLNDDYSIMTNLAGHQTAYKIEYNLYDAESGVYGYIDSNGYVLEGIKCPFGDWYIGIVKSKIIDKQTISSEREIEYLYVSKSVSGKSLQTEKLVKYDYGKYGEIAGYQKGKLLTTGGTMSGVINFSGDNVNILSATAGETAESSSWDSVIVFSSVNGLKGIKDSDGKVLFNAVYDKIVVQGKSALAKMGEKYFVIDLENISATKIDNIEPKFDKYVFSAIGFYFTNSDIGKYDIYKFNGDLYKSNQSVKITESEDRVFICIGETELLECVLPNGIVNKNIEIEKVVPGIGLSLRAFSTKTNNAVASDNSLSFSSVNTDSETGAGYATVELNYSQTDLASLAFLGVANLTIEQKALVPTFDDQSKSAYVSSVDGSVYLFDGVAFKSNSTMLIAFIRLKNETTNDTSYMINIALKNAYLQSAKLVGTKNGSSANFVYFMSGTKQSSELAVTDVLPGATLSANVGLYNETQYSESRTVNYLSAGYDGGMVFVSDSLDSISLKIVVSNIYVATYLTSGFYDFSNYSNNSVIEKANYYIKIIKSGSTKKVVLVAKDGYAFKGAKFVSSSSNSIIGNSDKTAIASSTDYARSYTVDYSSASGQYFGIENINMVELYSRLTFNDVEGGPNASFMSYYFYGYADNVSSSRNPASLGFSNFLRKSTTAVFIRDGYTFDGFAMGGETIVVDKNGVFVGSPSLFVSDQSTVAEFVLIAKYTPKQYTIQYKNGGNILTDKSLTVEFDSKIGKFGALLTKDQIEIPFGYTFIGWQYGSDLLTNESNYTYPSDIVVEAKYQENTYTLKFNTNISAYQGVSIKGFNANITKAVFTNDFLEFTPNEQAGSVITKEITFSKQIGYVSEGRDLEMPEIKGVGESGEIYNFMGWYDQQGYRYNGETLVCGNKYTKTSVVNESFINNLSDLTLYAHYERAVYMVSLVDNGQDKVPGGTGGITSHFQKITYQGSTFGGTKKSFSTINEDGYDLLLNNGNKSYSLYGVAGEALSCTAFVNSGYYISKIIIVIYDGVGSNTYELIGSVDQSGYVLSGEVPNLTVSASKSNVSLSFDKLNMPTNSNGENLYATITLETAEEYYKNTFVIDGSDVGVSRGSEFSTTTNAVDSNLIYGSKNIYNIALKTGTSSSYTHDLSYLKMLTINQIVVEFDSKYSRAVSGNYYQMVKATNLEELSTEISNGNIITTYQIDAYVLVLTLNTLTLNNYIQLTIPQYIDNQIEIETEDYSSSVTLNFSNVSSDAQKRVGMTASLGSASGTAVESGYSRANVRPSTDVVFTLQLDINHFIMAEYGLSVKYAGVRYNVFGFTTNVKNQKVSQTKSDISPKGVFSTVANQTGLSGTMFFVEYDKASGKFNIKIVGICEDIEIDLQYLEYKLLTVKSLNEGAYSAKVSTGIKDGQTLDSLASENGAEFKKFSENNLDSYLILKNESTINQIKILTNNSDAVYYKFINPSENCVITDSDSVATISYTQSVNTGFVEVSSISRSFIMKSYIGQGQSGGEYVYSPDPISGTVQTSALTKYYFNSTELQTYTYKDSITNISFTGVKLEIEFSIIKNYKLYEYGLYNENNQKVAEVDLVQTGSTLNLKYNLGSNSGNEFEFRIYFKPYEFNITYDLEGNVKDTASSSLEISADDALKFENQVAYYNVTYTIPNVVLSRVGYTFSGYSKSLDGNVAYVKNQQIVNFDIAEDDMTETMQINLYAIYEANEYGISYIERDVNSKSYKLGSTNADYSGDFEGTIFFDTAFSLPQLNRVGYEFTGWYYKITGTETENQVEGPKIDNETKLDVTLFNQLSFSTWGQIELYAGWEVKNITVNFDKNQDSGTEQTVVEISNESITIEFDKDQVVLPTISREGYDFMGFSVQKYNADVDVTNLITTNKILNYDYITDYNITISEQNNFTLYAVWKYKVYTIYIDTQKETLRGDDDCEFVISGYTGVVDGKYYISIAFGSKFAVVPNITATGYTYKGVFTEKTNGTQITSDTKVDSAFVQSFITGQECTIYAQYEIDKYTITVDKGELESSNPEGDTVVLFFDNFLTRMKTACGYYVKQIQVFSDNEIVTIDFDWDSVNQKIVIKKVSSSKDSSLDGLDQSTTMYNEIIIEHGFNSDTSYSITFNVIEAKSDMTIKVTEVKSQEFLLSLYTFAQGTNGQDSYKVKYAEEKYDIITGGVGVYQEKLLEEFDYPYLPGYKFAGYYFATVSGSVITKGEAVPLSQANKVVIGSNTSIIAYYEESLKQGINFYFYDSALGAYSNATGDDYLMYWKGSSGWSKNEDKFTITPFDGDEINILAGKIKTLPSIGAGQWPNGYVPCGFIITNSAPSSGNFYTSSSITSVNEFNSSTKIETMLNVYAVYEEQVFELSSAGVKHNVFVEDNGVYHKYTGEVEYYQFTSDPTETFNNYVTNYGDTAEVAFAKIFSTGGAKKVSSVSGSGWFIAVILGVDSTSGKVIFYKVSNIYAG